jgi:translocation protein SEC63
MTFFREAFTKDRKEALSYDDSATLFFFGTILFVIVTIWTFFFFYNFFYPLKETKTGNILSYILCPANNFKYCHCKECVKKIDLKRHKIISLKNRLFRQTKILQIFCLGVLYILVYKLIQNLSTASEIRAFQPFEILNIQEGVNETLIRKAYRRMSLLHHPDRHPTDPQAAAKFMLITKAYHALTDEVNNDCFCNIKLFFNEKLCSSRISFYVFHLYKNYSLFDIFLDCKKKL